ncbi:BON domain-containing protein [Mucilaginibacter sp. P25]|uniref:Osmotically-inducible protein OsmY, contains BON domain n=1 Tax=Mucilaginibacter gossypii TaxID=551996 RepID=A0A1G7U386_9SPHI|nr:BON domain-containing protein [Mucilaginibacter gossypii]SDG42082.1 Osmotically-inducible protein OsmY, contains BON domain [Mucilaginibacter gossypii]
MKTDLEIQKDVMDELKWHPILHDAEIKVSVKKGVVTLCGQVDTYGRKLAAENAARKVAGVKALAENIQIGVSPAYNTNDGVIAEAVLHALKWHTGIPEDSIKVKVENGIVMLEGEVEWDVQRNSASTAIQHLHGVKAVNNSITIRPKVSADDLAKKISEAFLRRAAIDAARITVSVSGNKATLTGKVRSFAEKEEAEDIVWAAPGVTSLDSKLIVEEPELMLQSHI